MDLYLILSFFIFLFLCKVVMYVGILDNKGFINFQLYHLR